MSFGKKDMPCWKKPIKSHKSCESEFEAVSSQSGTHVAGPMATQNKLVKVFEFGLTCQTSKMYLLTFDGFSLVVFTNN